MKIITDLLRGAALCVVAFYLTTANAQAATLVYDVQGFTGTTYTTYEFSLESAQGYELTLTDFGFPDSIAQLGVTLSSATEMYMTDVMFSDDSSIASDRDIWGGSGHFSSSSNSLFGGRNWGTKQQQRQYNGFLEAGTYFLSVYGEMPRNWYFGQNGGGGLYGVEMIATPVPASILFLSSGLACFGYISRRRKKS
jgi:hypothetical protein